MLAMGIKPVIFILGGVFVSAAHIDNEIIKNKPDSASFGYC
jgi:uncharacterized protein YneF (UPF0154 family)